MTLDRILWPTIVLANHQFIANDSANSVTLYDFTGKAIHKFVPATGQFRHVQVTPDEKYVLIESDDGSLRLSEIQSGVTIWSKSSHEDGSHYLHAASFSADGQSFVVCAGARVLVFKTSTGSRVCSIGFDDGEQDIDSAALSPDGSKGVIVRWNKSAGQVFTFDNATDKPRDTSLVGGPCVRYSSDGRYFAMPSNDFNSPSQLSVVDATAKIPSFVDVGNFERIWDIRPTRDGQFLVTGDLKFGDGSYARVGQVCNPATGQMLTVWKSTPALDALGIIDVDLPTLVGVCTDSYFRISLVDLRTGTARLIVDNSKNSPDTASALDRENRMRANGCGPIGTVGLGGIALLVGSVSFIYSRRRSGR